MTHVILAAILTLMPTPSPKWGESYTEFRARMELIAQAISYGSQVVDGEVPRRQLAMAVAVTFWGEGRFSPLVQAGERRGDSGLAICLGGLHPVDLSHEEWLKLAGLDLESTTRCATVTAQRLKRSIGYCRNLDPRATWTHAFTLYGTGRTCRPEETRWKAIFIDRGEKWGRLASSSRLTSERAVGSLRP
jgi:hypothetical protein